MKREDLDDLIDAFADDVRRPPETPRERMWARIDAARAGRRGKPRGRILGGPWTRFAHSRLWWPTAAAALLVLGVGLGRFLPDGGTSSPVGPAVVAENPLDDPLLAYVAVDVLDRAETLLTGFRMDEPTAADAALAKWAGGLLVDTRLLLESRLGADPRLGPLLADLEYTLAQMALLDGPARTGDRAWIADGLARRATLERLRTVVQPGAARLSL